MHHKSDVEIAAEVQKLLDNIDTVEIIHSTRADYRLEIIQKYRDDYQQFKQAQALLIQILNHDIHRDLCKLFNEKRAAILDQAIYFIETTRMIPGNEQYNLTTKEIHKLSNLDIKTRPEYEAIKMEAEIRRLEEEILVDESENDSLEDEVKSEYERLKVTDTQHLQADHLGESNIEKMIIDEDDFSSDDPRRMELYGYDVENVNDVDADGNTALHLAVLEKDINKVKFLLQIENINVNITNKNSETALDLANKIMCDYTTQFKQSSSKLSVFRKLTMEELKERKNEYEAIDGRSRGSLYNSQALKDIKELIAEKMYRNGLEVRRDNSHNPAQPSLARRFINFITRLVGRSQSPDTNVLARDSVPSVQATNKHVAIKRKSQHGKQRHSGLGLFGKKQTQSSSAAPGNVNSINLTDEDNSRKFRN